MNTEVGLWPEGRRFAFTIVDDTDFATLENVKPVYDFLHQTGFRITKTVWPLAPTETATTGGDTLENPNYRAWVRDLQTQGMEIAYHGATDHTSPRERVIESLDRFKTVVGHDPYVYASHVGQREAMYWGAARLDGLPRRIFRALNGLAGRDDNYYGELRESPCFWGDVCRSRITYTRGFTLKDINTLKLDPHMPYHDPRRPYVRYWFSGSDGPRVSDFIRLIEPDHQDRLLEEGGACILYTHLGSGFVESGKVNPDFVRLMERLARLPGWFVPVRELLDHLRTRPGWCPNADLEHLRRVQWMWLRQNLGPGQWARLLKRVWRRWGRVRQKLGSRSSQAGNNRASGQ
jgi:hypothetical protein